MSELDVLVVSYRRADLLTRCLDSVARHLPLATVHVWDNFSEGSHEVRRVADSRPHVHWTFSADNVGFAAAVNALVRDSTADTLLLNPDAELVTSLDATRALASRPGVAAAAPMWAQDEGGSSFLWDVAHRSVGPVRALISYSGYASALRRLPVSDLYPAPPSGGVGYLTGACLLVKRTAWAAVGPFDERFFLYSEEVDWARRARSLGWELRLAPEHAVRHAAHGTVAGSEQQHAASLQRLQESQVKYLRKHFGAYGAAAYRAGAALLRRYQRSKR